jgi:outer membrane protein OmpA-like peptidoglycan-associated protein
VRAAQRVRLPDAARRLLRRGWKEIQPMKTLLAAIVVCVASSLGCSSPRPAFDAVDLPPPRADGTYGGFAWPAGMPPATRAIQIALGPDALAECNVVRPHFQLDSSELRAHDAMLLASLATCLNDPELSGRPIELVGHADRSGEPSYNERLGMRRAERVKELLVANGVDPARIRIVTRGERDAQADGFYADGWDRRVDVRVSGGAHRPYGRTDAP